MNSPPVEPIQPLLDAEANARLGRRLETAAWGLFFVWLGVIWFAEVGWYWGMIGIGAIFLGEAMIRGVYDLKVSGVAVMFGILFLGGGIWGLAAAPFALLPTLFVLFGLAMVWRAVMSSLRRRG